MRYFQLLAVGISTAPALAEVAARPSMWRRFTARQETPGSAHHDTECIVLRGPASITVDAMFNETTAHWYRHPEQIGADALGTLIGDVVDLLGNVEELGRVMVVNLKPHGHITPHVDEGAYAAHYERFHLVLSAAPGNWFYCGDEAIYMKPGELWKFDHHTEHQVRNLSEQDRIHIIIDARRKLTQEQ